MVEINSRRVGASLLPIVVVFVFAVSAATQQPAPSQLPAERLHLKGKPASVTVAQPGAIPVLGATVVKTFPHDPQAFTQGLEYFGGFLYESTGRQRQSTLRQVAIETG